MKNSNTLSGATTALERLEECIERAEETFRSNKESYNDYLNECKEAGEEPDKWNLNYHRTNLEASYSTLVYLRKANEYIFENLNKIGKEIQL